MLQENQEDSSEIQERQAACDDTSSVGRQPLKFGAKIVLHLLYDNPESAAVAGHQQHGYGNVAVKDPIWFQSKEAFMGMVFNAFEDFYDSLLVKDGRAVGKS